MVRRADKSLLTLLSVHLCSAKYASETEERHRPYLKYTAENNSGHRKRRATIGEKNTCYLYLRADPILWEHIKFKKYNTKLVSTGVFFPFLN